MCLVISLGKVPRWDLLEQVALADNFNREGMFYPEPKKFPGTASVYFPGVVAMLATFFNYLGVKAFFG